MNESAGGADFGLIQFAIPFFFLLIILEFILNRFYKKDYYDLNDSIADLSCGIAQQLTAVFWAGAFIWVYSYFYEHCRLITLTGGRPLVFLLCFIGVDLAYYWFHRSCHRINLFWGGHAAHHQSEEYNLTVALRQGSFSEPLAFIFYLPLAILGFHPVLFFICKELNIIYQFWIHTRMIGKMGWLEGVFNTPSHHRVHHGKNPKYIDKNHAGVLILWDKLFGTFQVEEEEPVYGTVTPFASWNPIWANIEHWYHVFQGSRNFSAFGDKVKVWFMPPGWTPDQPEPHIPDVVIPYNKFRTTLSNKLKTYVLFHFVISLTLSLAFLSFETELNTVLKALSVLFLLFSMFNLSGIQETKKWAFPFELLRLSISLLAILAIPIEFSKKMILALPMLIFLFWLTRIRENLNTPPNTWR